MNWPALKAVLPRPPPLLLTDKLPENESETVLKKISQSEKNEKGKMKKNKHNLPL